MIVWIVLIIAIVIIIGLLIAIYKRHGQRLNNLASYTVLLVLGDEYREQVKRDLLEHIKNSKENNPVNLLVEVEAVIERLADHLAYQEDPYQTPAFLSCKLIESIKGKTN